MRDFFRRLFRRDPTGVIPVSLVMDPMVYARLDRLARRTGFSGDSLVSCALNAWLDEHEAGLLNRSAELREIS